MTPWARYLIGLALALPMGAYVAGSLMASAADDPVNRDPVRIQDVPSESSRDGDGRATRPSDEPTRKPPRPAEATDDDVRDHDRGGRGDDDVPDDDTDDNNVDDNGVRVVTPQPTRLDDGDDDDAGDDNGTDRDDGDDDDDKSRDRSRDESRDD